MNFAMDSATSSIITQASSLISIVSYLKISLNPPCEATVYTQVARTKNSSSWLKAKVS
jgi:hypothetical protein